MRSLSCISLSLTSRADFLAFLITFPAAIFTPSVDELSGNHANETDDPDDDRHPDRYLALLHTVQGIGVTATAKRELGPGLR